MKPIETEFPVVQISLLAERESWRKEIFRPNYHIHKWWANRLGSVFRGLVLGAIAPEGEDIWASYYKTHCYSDKIVLDPFMGSGTTLGEVAKLGAKPIGCDINPVSTFAVTQSLTNTSTERLEEYFLELEKDIQPAISHYYSTIEPSTGESIPVLYYFWVKQAVTPLGEVIPLFSSYVFSKNAYPSKKPLAKIVCPQCWEINTDHYNATRVTCSHCHFAFNPQTGPVNGRYVTDSRGEKYEVRQLLPPSPGRFEHRLYAIMALSSNGDKVYLPARQYDLDLMQEATAHLDRENLPLPTMEVRPGHNTDQARNYHYLHWRDFFNDRQLLCLGLLLKRILQIEDHVIRDQLVCLFSTCLEYNNMFCTFKGEGTGAVRPLFSNHILKPERTPLENNVWGTSQSSGSFSKLFRSKLLKAKEYLQRPFELTLDPTNKAGKSSNYVASHPISVSVTDSWSEFSRSSNCALILNGDGAELPIPDKVVDAIVTDPPYFDFVHYSELSDFFYAWLSPVLGMDYNYLNRVSSYHEREVQNKHVEIFAHNLARVFSACRIRLRTEKRVSKLVQFFERCCYG